MKRIKINESQYRMLIESGALLDGSETKKEFNDTNEIGVTNDTHDVSGDLKRGKPASSDRIGKSLTPQSWPYGARRGGVVY